MRLLTFMATCSAAILCGACSRRDQRPDRQVSATVTDHRTGLVWTAGTSRDSLTWQQAQSYCRNLSLGGLDDWRLPTRAELESIIVPGLTDPNPDASPVPLQGPFSQSGVGFLYSGTAVPGYRDSPWVMNIRNGHIFNGQGVVGMARCVRDTRFRASPPTGH